MDQVEIATMLPGAIPFEDQNINPTWKAQVKTHISIDTAFVKRISPRKLYVECICAVLGRHLGLPIPKPMIIKVDHASLPEIPECCFELAFGSEDAGYPSFRRFAKSAAAMEKLKDHAKSLDIAVFDEWIANFDRNIGNILYDGGDNFVFIDHENALYENLKPEDSASDNDIMRVLYSFQSEFEKHQAKRDSETDIIPMYREVPFSVLPEKTFATNYLDEKQVDDVINFLQQRINHLSDLLRSRLNFQQQGLAL